MTRKHYNQQECENRRWFSKPVWRKRGLKIHDDAKPVGTLWVPGVRRPIEVYAEEQGTRIEFSMRETKLRWALEDIAKAKWKGEALTDETALRLQEMARSALAWLY